jgi:hypothetical protein
MAQITIWNGSSTFVSGETPFGFYDADTDFSQSIDKFADWSARRLGYPLIDIELQSGSFYACFEEAVTEYSAQINQFNIKDNLLHLQGQRAISGSSNSGSVSLTGQSGSVTHKRLTPTLGRNIFLAEQYGTEAGVGGFVNYKTGSIQVTADSQVYDLNAFAEASASGNAIEIRRVFHESSPAIARYFDPYAGTGQGTINMLSSFGWGAMSPATTFLMMPIYADILRIQAIEFNDIIRKSGYSFELRNNQIRIFPNPTTTFNVWFEYIVRSERDNPLITEYSGSADVVSDFSNAPYANMEYNKINDVGKQWIRKYGLALCKELLGMIRSKYGSVPIPNAEVTLDGETLRGEASAEKEALITELREILELSSRRSLLEADQEEAEHLQQKLNKVPLPIWIG